MLLPLLSLSGKPIFFNPTHVTMVQSQPHVAEDETITRISVISFTEEKMTLQVTHTLDELQVLMAEHNTPLLTLIDKQHKEILVNPALITVAQKRRELKDESDEILLCTGLFFVQARHFLIIPEPQESLMMRCNADGKRFTKLHYPDGEQVWINDRLITSVQSLVDLSGETNATSDATLIFFIEHNDSIPVQESPETVVSLCNSTLRLA